MRGGKQIRARVREAHFVQPRLGDLRNFFAYGSTAARLYKRMSNAVSYNLIHRSTPAPIGGKAEFSSSLAARATMLNVRIRSGDPPQERQVEVAYRQSHE